MGLNKSNWCARCFLRITPDDMSTVYNGTDYHQHCFLKLVREEADEERAKRSYFNLNCRLGRQHVSAQRVDK